MLNRNYKYGRFDHSRLDIAVSEVLYWVWDPIGVHFHDYSARDEYDGYALQILGIVINDDSDEVKFEKLYKKLAELRTIQMGLRENATVDREVSERILALREHCK
jgi:hypothetical protein